ncbi:OmpH family outer membrane protein [Gemmatimonas sp.]|jgi:outer membrane protein|uniref:OmpH family outer membrane protein n=1 Tax=Gemmatimonas sp. TaxID=1962908 RepID=UPI0027B94240|nr:OmpH family outer membrane protein [Gemmatimonas sp.]
MRLLTVVGAVAVLASVPSLASAQGQKFAFVNSQALLQNAPGRGEAEATFEKEMVGIRAQLTKLQDSLTAMNEAWAKEEPTLQAAAKEARLKVLREKEQNWGAQAQKLQSQAQDRQEELMAPIMENLRKVLDDMRMEGGYSFIFDVAAGSFIVSADKNLDITDRVMAKMRLSAPKAAPAARPAPAAKPATPGPTSAPAGITKKPPTE